MRFSIRQAKHCRNCLTVYLAAWHGDARPCFEPRYCFHLSCDSTMWFDFQVCRFRSGHRGGATTQLSFKVNSRGQRPGSGARSHKGPVSVRVPAENLSVGGIVLTSKSRKRNYWLTAMWQWYFLFPEALPSSEGRARQSENQQSD